MVFASVFDDDIAGRMPSGRAADGSFLERWRGSSGIGGARRGNDAPDRRVAGAVLGKGANRIAQIAEAPGGCRASCKSRTKARSNQRAQKKGKNGIVEGAHRPSQRVLQLARAQVTSLEGVCADTGPTRESIAPRRRQHSRLLVSPASSRKRGRKIAHCCGTTPTRAQLSRFILRLP